MSTLIMNLKSILNQQRCSLVRKREVTPQNTERGVCRCILHCSGADQKKQATEEIFASQKKKKKKTKGKRKENFKAKSLSILEENTRISGGDCTVKQRSSKGMLEIHSGMGAEWSEQAMADSSSSEVLAKVLQSCCYKCPIGISYILVLN